MKRILNSNPRSGTHYLKQVISAALDTAPVERDWETEDGLFGALSSMPDDQLLHGHFRFSRDADTLDDELFPDLRMVVLNRHPVDRLISQIAWQRVTTNHLPDPHAPAQQLARDLLLGHWDGKVWPSGFVVDDFAAHHNFLLHDRVTSWLARPSCHYVKFEELIASPVQGFLECFDFLEIRVSRHDIEQILERINFFTLSGGRVPGEMDCSSHYRRGLCGEWRQVFAPEDLAHLRPKYSTAFAQSGYDL